MRKTITIMLAAAALFGLGAQPAAADDPYAKYETETDGVSARVGSFTSQECRTPNRTGVWGQYGAWGNYVDGCTVSRRCERDYCRVTAATGGLYSPWSDKQYSNSKKTCNVRMRVFDSNGSFKWHRDASDSVTGVYAWGCRADAGYAYLRRGETATVQGNGVRDDLWGSAQVIVYLELAY